MCQDNVIRAIALLAFAFCFHASAIGSTATNSPDHEEAAAIGATTNKAAAPEYELIYIDELPEASPALSNYHGSVAMFDWLHDWTFYTVQQQAEEVDSLLSRDDQVMERVPISEFRIGLYGKVVDRSGLEREEGITIGLARALGKYIEADAGLRLNWPPDVFGRLSWKQSWRAGPMNIYPEIRGFWKSDDGFGTKGNLTLDYWINRWLTRSVSAAKFTEETEGIEWDQSIIIGYAAQLLEEKKLGRRASFQDVAKGVALRYTISGNDNGQFLVNQHRVTAVCKFPLHRRWLYGILAPELTLSRERGWEEEFGIKFGFDMLFWGIGDR